MGDTQFAYNKRLYEYCREDETDLFFTSLVWREAMYKATGVRKRAFPTSYRDGPAAPWSDEEALREARREAAALGFESDSREKKSEEKKRSFSVGNAETS
jgi:phosphopantetheinyl transferase